MTGELSYAKGVAVIGGGSGGLGAAVAVRLAGAGVPVVVTYHSNADRARELCDQVSADGGDCTAVRCDLTDPDAVDELLADAGRRHGRVAQVVYAAGPSFGFHFIGQIPNEEWHRVVHTDVHGAFHLTQSAVRTFKEQGDGGNLVALITSATGRVAPADILSAGPKAAIETLLKGVARECGRFGIRANCVGPGWIDSGLGASAWQTEVTEAQRRKILTEMIPLRRLGAAEDVAWAVAFLCSDQAAFITGQTLAVDGGAQV